LISQLSHNVTLNSSCNLTFKAAPGSVSYKIGTAKFKKAFFIFSVFSCFKIFTSSIVYKPAIAAVVVAKAGTILPAFNFT